MGVRETRQGRLLLHRHAKQPQVPPQQPEGPVSRRARCPCGTPGARRHVLSLQRLARARARGGGGAVGQRELFALERLSKARLKRFEACVAYRRAREQQVEDSRRAHTPCARASTAAGEQRPAQHAALQPTRRIEAEAQPAAQPAWAHAHANVHPRVGCMHTVAASSSYGCSRPAHPCGRRRPRRRRQTREAHPPPPRRARRGASRGRCTASPARGVGSEAARPWRRQRRPLRRRVAPRPVACGASASGYARAPPARPSMARPRSGRGPRSCATWRAPPPHPAPRRTR
eukprot:scaffold30172_cov62-Phaeocystis_antarctica.AAC.4